MIHLVLISNMYLESTTNRTIMLNFRAHKFHRWTSRFKVQSSAQNAPQLKNGGAAMLTW